MAKPINRWQLLLVADDGRIIPFQRIKGIAVTLVTVLVLLGVVCAGLGWQLAVEKVRHRKTLDQLTDAGLQVAHYKSERELITAELVLAEARMEKAGLLIPKRQERISQQTAVTSIHAEPVPDTILVDGAKKMETAATVDTMTEQMPEQTVANQPLVSPTAAPGDKRPTGESVPAQGTVEPKPPAVALGDLKMEHDAGKKILLARFRVKNTGPRSSPIDGRCVVVLKNDQMAPEAWLAMPGVTLVNGKPDGERGQAFRISRFIDMEIKAMGQRDPSSFKTATIYVFDTSGAKVLEKKYPIDLPAPKPEPESVSAPAQPAGETVTADDPAGEAAVHLPMANPSDADAGAVPPPVPIHAPVDDPPLNEAVEPVKKEDVRSRF